MKAVILVPYRSDGAERERNWRYCRTRWQELGLPIREGDSDAEWSRARALNRSAEGEWDVAFIMDADTTFRSGVQVHKALTLASRSGSYVAAHDTLYYLTEKGTGDALRGTPLPECEHDGLPVQTWLDGVAVRRDVWDEAGGFDERFVGWGYQGAAFMCAVSKITEKERIPGDIYHLAHPGTWGGKDKTHLEANRALYEKEYA